MRGFKNNDNTCYLNALLQVLLACDNCLQLVPSNRNTLCDYLKEIVTEYPADIQPLDVTKFKTVFFLHCRDRFDSSLTSGQQQDCHEFFLYFCNLFSSLASTPVENCVSIFQFIKSQTIKCNVCHTTTSTSTNDFALEVTLRPGSFSGWHIGSLILADKQDLNIKRQCSTCGHSSARMESDFQSYPECLVLSLKRFY